MNHIKKIGLFGFGTVGKGFYEILKNHPDVSVSIEKVCIKRLDLERIGHELYFTDDANELLEDPNLDIIIEAIDDADIAKEIVHQALKSGKAVISANKKMIAESIKEVHDWHLNYEAPFLYEGAVAGAIPIINTIESYLKDCRISCIEGILNGSSNYILTKMQQENLPFEKALKDAQKKGFAESDPTLDVGGFDASYKLAILAYHAFGDTNSLRNCRRQNIAEVTPKDIEDAQKQGKKIKPIASISYENGQLTSIVGTQLVDASHGLFNVENEFNAVSLDTKLSGRHILVGKGAGDLATGSALFCDLRRVLDGYKYAVFKDVLLTA